MKNIKKTNKPYRSKEHKRNVNFANALFSTFCPSFLVCVCFPVLALWRFFSCLFVGEVICAILSQKKADLGPCSCLKFSFLYVVVVFFMLLWFWLCSFIWWWIFYVSGCSSLSYVYLSLLFILVLLIILAYFSCFLKSASCRFHFDWFFFASSFFWGGGGSCCFFSSCYMLFFFLLLLKLF